MSLKPFYLIAQGFDLIRRGKLFISKNMMKVFYATALPTLKFYQFSHGEQVNCKLPNEIRFKIQFSSVSLYSL